MRYKLIKKRRGVPDTKWHPYSSHTYRPESFPKIGKGDNIKSACLVGGQKNDAMNPKTHFRRLNIALLLSDKPVPQIIAEAEHYVLMIQGNSYFPKPSPDLPAISAQIALLDQAYHLSLTRVRGSVSAMHTELQKLCVMVSGLAGYVQTIANQDPEHAALIINSTGMQIKKAAPSPLRVFRVRRGKYSNIYFGTKVKFEIEQLDTGVEYFFRAAYSIRGVMTAWSVVESIFSI
jgi:hypothetical protein